ncbi:MAG TPA: hypothetical protein VIJ29_04560 [Candidatus Paceibacterota bacterium]
MFKKSNIAIMILVAIVLTFTALPAIMVMAQSGGGAAVTANPYTAPNLWPTGYWGKGGLISCQGSFLSVQSVNGQTVPPTCSNLCDLINTFINIVYFLMSIAIFVITPIMFVWGGIMIMVSGANPEMLGTGKKILTGAVIGLAIVLCSYLLISTVLKVLNVTAIGGFGGAACTPD